jgi:predicted extracellular nuclease
MSGKVFRCTLALALLATASAADAGVVISQIYGGGGNSGATLKNDFIELFNDGSSSVDITGWSVQYTSATGTSWQVTNLGGTLLQPGHYYLVQEAQGSAGTVDLPAPDATGSIAMSGTAGKVALVSSTTALSGGCPSAGAVDFVGFGTTANCHLGTGNAAAPSNTTADIRAKAGCTNGADNSTDFAAGTPIPRNTATAAHVCGLGIDSVAASEGDSGTKDFVFTVTLSEPAPAGGVTFDIATADNSATVADGDYVARALSGESIGEGQTQYQFTVQVNGDTKSEADEQFFINVSNISGSGITVTGAQGVGTIVNDDAPPTTIGVDNVSHDEGDSGTTDFVFTVSLSAPAPAGGVTFDIATADGTATAGSDYVALSMPGQTIAEGSTSAMFTVQVNGDSTFEPDETFVLNVTNVSGTNVDSTSRQATGTIVNDDPLSIGAIQGDGLASPYAGQTVITTGNVVTAVGAKGFAMQDPLGDGNPDTSDGIYVFTGSAPGVDVGDVVTVTASVQEFSGTTELGGSPIVMVTGVHVPIAPIVLDTALPSPNPVLHLCHGSLPAQSPAPGNWECIEDMLVQIDGVVTGATNGGGSADGTHPGTPGFFYATVGDAVRPFREAGVQYPGLNDPLHPDVPVWDGDPEIIEFYPPGAIGGPTSLTLNAGQHFTSTGIVGDFNGTYEIYPATFAASGDAPVTVQPVKASAAGTLTIGAQNMLHFFNDVEDSPGIDHCATQGSKDVCETTAQFSVRKQKLSLQIRSVLGAPAVVGVQEVENLATLEALAAQIHADDPALTYTAYLSEGNDIGGIDVGFLVRGDVGVNAVTQIGKNTLTSDGCGSGSSCPLNDRPPLLLDASFNGYHFAVLVIHDRSLSSIDDPTDGPRVRRKRLEQAQYVGEIVQAWQTGSSGPLSDGDSVPDPDATAPIIVVGDYNAYEFTDGYVDVTGQIKGSAVGAGNQVWEVPKTSPTFCDAGLTSDPATRYSFQFDGYVQELDHALLSRTGWRDFVMLANAHGNADTSEAGPEVTDATTPARSADHDGQVLTLATDRLFADGGDGDTCR